MCDLFRRRVHFQARAAVLSLVVIGIFATIATTCCASGGNDGMSSMSPDLRSGGVLEESYSYHRQPSMRTAGGWYNYGFPISTFRWGWFGAQHYYPTVFWHDGYYGDCQRYSYRRGY